MKAHFERSPKSNSRPPSGLPGPGKASAGRNQTMPGTGRPAGLPKTALLWGIPADSPAWNPLHAAQRFGLALRTVAPQELDATVGALCGIPGAEGTHTGVPAKPAGPAASTRPDAPTLPGSAAPLPAAANGPALILCGLPEAEREALLDALRDAGAVIPLKAIVTPTNQGWRFGELLAELAREHAALHGAR